MDSQLSMPQNVIRGRDFRGPGGLWPGQGWDPAAVGTWPDISVGIDSLVKNESDAREVKKRLADHTWCSLLVALIQLIERFNKAIELLTDAAKRFIKEALSRRFERRQPLMGDTDDIVTDQIKAQVVILFSARGGDVRRKRSLDVRGIDRTSGLTTHWLAPQPVHRPRSSQ